MHLQMPSKSDSIKINPYFEVPFLSPAGTWGKCTKLCLNDVCTLTNSIVSHSKGFYSDLVNEYILKIYDLC